MKSACCMGSPSSARPILRAPYQIPALLLLNPCNKAVRSPLPARHHQLAPSPPRPATMCAASSSNFNPVEAVQRESKLQSNRLPDAVRERVEGAVEKLRFRVTAGDVAAAAGVKVTEAEDALKALAYDSLAALEVSSEGEVVYSFPDDFKSIIRNKSIILRVKPFLSKAGVIANYMIRIAFGSALVTSVAVVWFAIFVITSSNSRDDNRNRSSGSSFGGMRMAMNLTDLFYYFDPYYYRTARQRESSGQEMSFLESIFSFVFGDGDPNEGFEAARWKQLGRVVQAKGGVVSGEELAPYLDPPPLDELSSSGSTFVDESFVLPALITFGGEPFVDEEGNLLYRFPSLQQSSTRKEVVRPPSDTAILERPWAFTAASGGQLFGTIALGVFNFVGILFLGDLLSNPRSAYILAEQGLGWVSSLLPWLQVYAAAFFAIPGLRWLGNQRRNAAIGERNDARSQAADVLSSASRGKLAGKLASARREGRRTVIAPRDTVFTTARDAGEQMQEQEVADWDSRLGSKDKW